MDTKRILQLSIAFAMSLFLFSCVEEVQPSNTSTTTTSTGPKLLGTAKVTFFNRNSDQFPSAVSATLENATGGSDIELFNNMAWQNHTTKTIEIYEGEKQKIAFKDVGNSQFNRSTSFEMEADKSYLILVQMSRSGAPATLTDITITNKKSGKAYIRQIGGNPYPLRLDGNYFNPDNFVDFYYEVNADSYDLDLYNTNYYYVEDDYGTVTLASGKSYLAVIVFTGSDYKLNMLTYD